MEAASSHSLSSSSLSSGRSSDDLSVRSASSAGSVAGVKFMCSYGGRIVPRYPDAKLRYIGGETRVVSVVRSISFSDLQIKLGELCGWGAVSVRCQIPTEDLDALVTVTSDEDLANLLEEYDLAAAAAVGGRSRVGLKIRAFLFAVSKSTRTMAFVPPPPIAGGRCVCQIAAPVRCPGRIESSLGYPRLRGRRTAYGDASRVRRPFFVHHGNCWQ